LVTNRWQPDMRARAQARASIGFNRGSALGSNENVACSVANSPLPLRIPHLALAPLFGALRVQSCDNSNGLPARMNAAGTGEDNANPP
jgi:hypothetical protein